MRRLLLILLPLAAQAQSDPQTRICATNPAYAPALMQTIIEAQLMKDHDASLDAAPPEKLAQQASAQGITECATALRRDPDAQQALGGLSGGDIDIGWDAFNTACDDHPASKGACIRTEVASEHALHRMSTTDQPAGARALVQTCQLVLQTSPTMAAWRECVDQALAVHAPASAAKRCKVSVTWHTAKTGPEAGSVVADCLQKKG